jgi:hypothetical protein
MPEAKYITYEELDDGTIVRIMLNRLKTRNAQNRGLRPGRRGRQGAGGHPRWGRPLVLLGS